MRRFCKPVSWCSPQGQGYYATYGCGVSVLIPVSEKSEDKDAPGTRRMQSIEVQIDVHTFVQHAHHDDKVAFESVVQGV